MKQTLSLVTHIILRLAGTLHPNDALAFDDTTSNRYAILFVVRDDYETQHPEKAEQLKKFIHIYQNSAQVKQAINAEVGEKLWFAGWNEESIMVSFGTHRNSHLR